MSSAAQAIQTASQQYTLYVSFVILFSGVFGHCCNLIVLTRHKAFRGNPSTTYLIAESVVNLFQMLVPFTSRIAMNGFANDLTQTSLFWCKLRNVATQSSTLISLSIVCFAAIDQYFSTSYHLYLRRMSSTGIATILIAVATIGWILHGVPTAIFVEIQPTSGCSIYNHGMINYIAYVYYLVLTGSLPIIVSTLFAALAYRNVRRIVRRQIPIRRRKLDQQLTAMILARVAFLVVTTTPYVLQRIYTYAVFISREDVVHRAIVTHRSRNHLIFLFGLFRLVLSLLVIIRAVSTTSEKYGDQLLQANPIVTPQSHRSRNSTLQRRRRFTVRVVIHTRQLQHPSSPFCDRYNSL